MATSRTDYTAEAVEAARSVLLKLTRLLGEYQDGIMLIDLFISRSTAEV
ncbi:MAG: hypothetical protein JXB85_15365 [Anaerolineales bacterium]|nr:hypothetical protein [Anaerolineales bacterium]